jgi:hypothetical protein
MDKLIKHRVVLINGIVGQIKGVFLMDGLNKESLRKVIY